MSLKSLAPRLITSPALRGAQRALAAAARRLSGRRPVVHYVHQVDDPHAALAVRALPHLEATYGVQVAPFLVSPPPAEAAPDRDRWRDWALRDAALLAGGLGMEAPFATAPVPARIAAAQAALAGCASAESFTATAAAIDAAWRGAPGAHLPEPTGDGQAACALGDNLRARLGSYLGGAFHFEGEWYWGLDRLSYLEQRLGASRTGARLFAPRLEAGAAGQTAAAPGVGMEAFVSLRSPYTYIAVPRLAALARATGAALTLRPVLPMVMRGLPVPLAKRLYIVRDVKREAERLGLPFGAIADPVGPPTERGLAILCAAIAQGQGEAFLLSFLQGVFADGIDAGTDKGLARICARAGISPQAMAKALSRDNWRAETEANRAEMLAAGVWGVPCFRVVAQGAPGPMLWGQDRLWALERALATA
jgi:2-hydroxychromene-2-carboxylate isomerase